jgi:predicted transcriptional regulator
MDPKTVVETLVERARKVGLPVSELARRADIAPSTFNRWRTGETSPTLDVFARVERVVTEAEEQAACKPSKPSDTDAITAEPVKGVA